MLNVFSGVVQKKRDMRSLVRSLHHLKTKKREREMVVHQAVTVVSVLQEA